MKYEVLLEKGNYALILRGARMEEYAVVHGLNNKEGCWDWTSGYWTFGKYGQIDQAKALSYALDFFRMRTESDYIPRSRLEELSTQFKDGLIECDPDFAEEYFDEVCEMSDKEKAWFEIEMESED